MVFSPLSNNTDDVLSSAELLNIDHVLATAKNTDDVGAMFSSYFQRRQCSPHTNNADNVLLILPTQTMFSPN